MAEGKKGKRPEKKSTINFVMSQYSILKAGIPGITMDTVVLQLKHGNYYLYKGEVEKIVEDERTKDPNFDVDLFLKILDTADAIKEGSTPRLTDTLVRVNSEERALQVANNPANANEVKAIVDGMTKIKEIADKISPLLDKKASISIALKNKKKKKKKSNKEVEKEEVVD